MASEDEVILVIIGENHPSDCGVGIMELVAKAMLWHKEVQLHLVYDVEDHG